MYVINFSVLSDIYQFPFFWYLCAYLWVFQGQFASSRSPFRSPWYVVVFWYICVYLWVFQGRVHLLQEAGFEPATFFLMFSSTWAWVYGGWAKAAATYVPCSWHACRLPSHRKLINKHISLSFRGSKVKLHARPKLCRRPDSNPRPCIGGRLPIHRKLINKHIFMSFRGSKV